MDKKRKDFLNKIGIWILVVIFIALVAFMFLRYVYYSNCGDLSCFQKNLQNCERTKYLSEGKTIYKYYIIGKRDGICKVNVALLGGEFEEADLASLQGKNMDCYLPLNSAVMPDQDISKCHGLLKEGLQDIMIKKLNFYIAENVGRINYQIYQSLTNKTA
jgi:hypothetical protein